MLTKNNQLNHGSTPYPAKPRSSSQTEKYQRELECGVYEGENASNAAPACAPGTQTSQRTSPAGVKGNAKKARKNHVYSEKICNRTEK